MRTDLRWLLRRRWLLLELPLADHLNDHVSGSRVDLDSQVLLLVRPRWDERVDDCGFLKVLLFPLICGWAELINERCGSLEVLGASIGKSFEVGCALVPTVGCGLVIGLKDPLALGVRGPL